MSQTLLIVIGIIAGIFLGALSNWVYDLLRQVGFLPDKPTLKRVVIIVLSFLPLAVLVALLQINTQEKPILSSEELKAQGAFVKIVNIKPSPEDTVFVTGVETPVVVVVEYYLPSNAVFPRIGLSYLTSSQEGMHYFTVNSVPAEVGRHQAQLAGIIKAPDPLALSDEPFEVAVFLDVLDQKLGHTYTVADDAVTFRLSAGK